MQKSLVVLALLGALLGRELIQPALAQGNSGPILIVHLRKIIDDSKEGREIVGKVRAEMAAKKEEIARDVKSLQENVNNLMKRKLYDRDEGWYKNVKAALDRQGQLKAAEQFFIAKLNDQIARGLNELIRGVQQESREVMKQRGGAMVIVSRMGVIEINSDKDLQDEVVFRRVLCADEKLNITDAVLKRMDKAFGN